MLLAPVPSHALGKLVHTDVSCASSGLAETTVMTGVGQVSAAACEGSLLDCIRLEYRGCFKALSWAHPGSCFPCVPEAL